MVRMCNPKKHYQTIWIKNRKVTLPQTHDTLSMVLRALTRSIGVICLSQYLQHLIWTVWLMLKNHKHLIPFIIVTGSLNQPHPTLQILRHTGLPPGQLHANKRDNWPVSCAGNTTYSNSRAVRFKGWLLYSPDLAVFYEKSFLQKKILIFFKKIVT